MTLRVRKVLVGLSTLACVASLGCNTAVKRARTALETGQSDLAIRLLEKRLADAPDDRAALALAGDAYNVSADEARRAKQPNEIRTRLSRLVTLRKARLSAGDSGCREQIRALTAEYQAAVWGLPDTAYPSDDDALALGKRCGMPVPAAMLAARYWRQPNAQLLAMLHALAPPPNRTQVAAYAHPLGSGDTVTVLGPKVASTPLVASDGLAPFEPFSLRTLSGTANLGTAPENFVTFLDVAHPVLTHAIGYLLGDVGPCWNGMYGIMSSQACLPKRLDPDWFNRETAGPTGTPFCSVSRTGTCTRLHVDVVEASCTGVSGSIRPAYGGQNACAVSYSYWRNVLRDIPSSTATRVPAGVSLEGLRALAATDRFPANTLDALAEGFFAPGMPSAWLTMATGVTCAPGGANTTMRYAHGRLQTECVIPGVLRATVAGGTLVSLESVER